MTAAHTSPGTASCMSVIAVPKGLRTVHAKLTKLAAGGWDAHEGSVHLPHQTQVRANRAQHTWWLRGCHAGVFLAKKPRANATATPLGPARTEVRLWRWHVSRLWPAAGLDAQQHWWQPDILHLTRQVANKARVGVICMEGKHEQCID
jgi:hypothetical protein